ncbi:p53 DNA-binding domain [Trinorchestia longiramus]|nr:p53 DNA-binding domain [Trinorchestia longiramus]
MSSSNEDVANTAQDDPDTLWKEYMSKMRSCMEEEMEVVASEGAVEWAELGQREQQLHHKIEALTQDIVNFKENTIRKAISRVNPNGSDCGSQGVVQGVVNFNRGPSCRPQAAVIQGRDDQYNSQGGSGIHPVVQQGQHLQQHQLHQQLPSFGVQPQMQFDNYAGAGSYYTPELSSVAPNAQMSYTSEQNSVLQYQGADMQAKLGYQGDVMSTPNINALSSLPYGRMQIQKQVQVVQSGPANEVMYISNRQQVTTAPCVSQSAITVNPGCSSKASSSLLHAPYSPGTQEISETIELLPVSRNSLRSPALSQLVDLPDLSELNDIDFSTESKFNPSPSSSKKELEANAEDISRADSIDVMQLSDWPGEYNFTINFPSDARNNRKWGYCDEVKRVFCQPNIAIEVQVRVDDWKALEGTNARVRLCPVYTDAHHRTTPVNRCDHHKLAERLTDKDSPHLDYLIQIDQKNADYGMVGRRQVVSAPLQPSRVGEEFATLLVKSSCMTSCVGGPNRRPFAVIFSLMVKGKEAGRRVLAIKCCKGVFRDMKAEKNRLQGTEGPSNDPLTLPPPSAPQPPPNTHTITINLNGKKRKSDVTTPANSDTERSPTKKGRDSIRFVNLPEQVHPPSGYCYMLLPVEYKQRITDYLSALRAKDYLRENHPDACKRYNI